MAVLIILHIFNHFRPYGSAVLRAGRLVVIAEGIITEGDVNDRFTGS